MGLEVAAGVEEGIHPTQYIPHITQCVMGKEENQLTGKTVLSSVGGLKT